MNVSPQTFALIGIALLSGAFGYCLHTAKDFTHHILHRHDMPEIDDGCPHCGMAPEPDRGLVLDVYAVGMQHGNRATLAGMYDDAQLGEYAEDWLEAVVAEGNLPPCYGRRRTADEPDDEIDHALTGMCKALSRA
jgi:hypothetical protein